MDITVRKLQRLVRSWRKQQNIYEQAMIDSETELSAQRYEGESIAFRWCAEDLEKLIKRIQHQK